MTTPSVEPAELNEEVWRAWVRKGKLRDAALARTFKIVATSALTLALGGTAVYYFLIKGA